MKKTEIGRYQMERVVREMLRAKAEIWGNVVGAAEIVAKWDGNVEQIDRYRNIQELNTKGVAAMKQFLRDEMTQVSLEVCRKTLV